MMHARGFGDGDISSLLTMPAALLDPLSPYGALTVDQVNQLNASSSATASGLADMEAAQAAQAASMQNVNLPTALASKIDAAAGPGMALPLAIIALGGVALLLIPSSQGRRR